MSHGMQADLNGIRLWTEMNRGPGCAGMRRTAKGPC